MPFDQSFPVPEPQQALGRESLVKEVALQTQAEGNILSLVSRTGRQHDHPLVPLEDSVLKFNL